MKSWINMNEPNKRLLSTVSEQIYKDIIYYLHLFTIPCGFILQARKSKEVSRKNKPYNKPYINSTYLSWSAWSARQLFDKYNAH